MLLPGITMRLERTAAAAFLSVVCGPTAGINTIRGIYYSTDSWTSPTEILTQQVWGEAQESFKNKCPRGF